MLVDAATSVLGRHSSIFIGRRVLVLEDEPLIALELVDMFEGLGCLSVGQAVTIASALQLIRTREPEFALLDYTIGAQASTEVAAELARRNIPFAFATGVQHSQIPAEFACIPFVSKPFELDDIENGMLQAFVASPFDASPGPLARPNH
jgi:CheY-like chemotaxis protein